jgi:GT2 family glycosyltransferase
MNMDYMGCSLLWLISLISGNSYDVEVKKGCIEKLIKAASEYPNAAILTPIIYHYGKYLGGGDFKILKFTNHNDKFIK